MRYKLIRKLKGCPLPVGTVSDGYCLGMYRFEANIPDHRAWDIPAWLCASMPHYFRRVKTRGDA